MSHRHDQLARALSDVIDEAIENHDFEGEVEDAVERFMSNQDESASQEDLDNLDRAVETLTEDLNSLTEKVNSMEQGADIDLRVQILERDLAELRSQNEAIMNAARALVHMITKLSKEA